MTEKEILDLIVSLVDGPIKGTELVTKIVAAIYDKNPKDVLQDSASISGILITGDNILNLLNKSVAMGDLLEVEYILPHMNYRIKSIYFPKGTEIKAP